MIRDPYDVNPQRRGQPSAAFAEAVTPSDAAPEKGSRRSGGRKGQTFNFKRFAKGERMAAMRQAARRS